MSLISIFFISLGLAADAFAVSISKGLEMQKVTLKSALKVSVCFGVFQGLMPLIGFFLGAQLGGLVDSIDHWLAFIILGYIGTNLLKDGLKKDNLEEHKSCDLSMKTLISLAIATSIDALAVGVTFAFLKLSILPAVIMISVLTTICCLIGVKIGNIFGLKYKSKAEILGGIILILIGFNILAQNFIG